MSALFHLCAEENPDGASHDYSPLPTLEPNSDRHGDEWERWEKKIFIRKGLGLLRTAREGGEKKGGKPPTSWIGIFREYSWKAKSRIGQ